MGHDVKNCSTDVFQKGPSVACPDNRNVTEFIDYQNLQGMLSNLRYASALKAAHGNPFFLNYGIHRSVRARALVLLVAFVHQAPVWRAEGSWTGVGGRFCSLGGDVGRLLGGSWAVADGWWALLDGFWALSGGLRTLLGGSSALLGNSWVGGSVQFLWGPKIIYIYIFF